MFGILTHGHLACMQACVPSCLVQLACLCVGGHLMQLSNQRINRNVLIRIVDEGRQRGDTAEAVVFSALFLFHAFFLKSKNKTKLLVCLLLDQIRITNVWKTKKNE